MYLNAILLSALVSTVALARTDLVGCTSSVSGPLLIWYVPGTGELCDFPDCGGGQAPPKYDNPACIGYTGTSTYSPSYLSGYGGANVAPVTTAVISASASSSTSWSAPATTTTTTGISAGSGSLDESGNAEGSSSGTFFAQTTSPAATSPVVTSPVTTPPVTMAVSSSRSASSLAVTKSASASTSSSTGAAPRASSGIGAGAVAVAAGLVGVAML